MNTWSQQQQQDKNYTNLLLTGYECKPVKILTYSLHRRFGEYGESSEKSLSLKSDVYVLAVGVESFRFDFNFYISSKHFMY